MFCDFLCIYSIYSVVYIPKTLHCPWADGSGCHWPVNLGRGKFTATVKVLLLLSGMYVYIYIHISNSRHLSSSLILSHSDFHRFSTQMGVSTFTWKGQSPRSVSRSSQTPGSAMAQDAGPNGREKGGGQISNSGNLRNRSSTPVSFRGTHTISIIDFWCSIWWSVSYLAPKKIFFERRLFTWTSPVQWWTISFRAFRVRRSMDWEPPV